MEPPRWAWAGGHSWDFSRRASQSHGRHAAWTTSPKKDRKTPDFIPSHASPSFATRATPPLHDNQPPAHTATPFLLAVPTLGRVWSL